MLREGRFLTDENIDMAVVQYLRREGHDVFDIKESGRFGMPDQEILSLALESRRFVITQDSDFGSLVYRDEQPFYGIIYLRPGHFNPEVHIESLKYLFEAELDCAPPCLIVAERTAHSLRIRIRQFPSQADGGGQGL